MKKVPQSKLLLQKLRLTTVLHSLYVQIYIITNLSMNDNGNDNVNVNGYDTTNGNK